MKNAGPTLTDLPAEILLYMLSYLTTRDVGACAMTVRALAAACDDHALWTRLYKQERTGEKARWQAGVRSMVAPIMLCSVWSKYQIKNGQNTPAYISNRIVQDIHDMLDSQWHLSIDLTALLGHPRFACAAHANVRVIMDSSFDAAPHARGLSSCAEDYIAVGTIIRCMSIECGYGSRITIQRGFFDADGVLCGPGLVHTQRRGREACTLWHACAGSWTGGRATMPDADALYDGGYRYRGGLIDGLCHGRGRAFDREGVIVAAGDWHRGVAQGSCSWRSALHQPALVGNAVFVDGTTAGPIAYFAHGRLVMRVPRLRSPYGLAKFVDRCPPLITPGSHHFASTHHTYTVYGPSGVTIASRGFFVHTWPDGSLTVGTRQGEHHYSIQAHYTPMLFVDTRGLLAASNGAPLLIALDSGSTFVCDQRTLAVRMHGGPSIDPALCDLVNRDPDTVADTPPGLTPDTDGSHQTPVANSATTHGTQYGVDADDDYGLVQQDFVRAIAAASRGRTGLDEADQMGMPDDVHSASGALLALLDTCAAAPPPTPSLCNALSGGRVRDTIFVRDTELPDQTSNLDMSRCAMRRCVIVDATFDGCDFRRARFERCVFYGCRFARCAFFGAVLVDTRFEACCFSYGVDTQAQFMAPFDIVDTASARLILAGSGAHIVQTTSRHNVALGIGEEEKDNNERKRKR
ncbi:Pentapeptide repeat containing protein [Pandoravirus quercus]|uniref:Pentapeptide repeat containing protein n=2 Tax=Pandoravirus TaxID=2060084 RepID=A0A2U7U907_9VIRU|nr:Pentapeptide repeat containing protein [Pandoravirus quercus]AVK74927.1 Pentapeptide repeat containing protein [Pandoravirus quercus]QBZ81114.1 Pentapeptide superfamily domain containing protein [Pandoravirus celtis]